MAPFVAASLSMLDVNSRIEAFAIERQKAIVMIAFRNPCWNQNFDFRFVGRVGAGKPGVLGVLGNYRDRTNLVLGDGLN